ncbi:MAG: O-antigen ligase family protein [Nitrospira sp.]|nr:O-antigen ligase family protein [Nitrospira sp.]
MHALSSLSLARARSTNLSAALAPAEYGYYFVIFYTVLGAPLGIILLGSIGSGFLLIPVLALCFLALGSDIQDILRAAWIPLACGLTYLFIQIGVHGESLYEPYVYPFGQWVISLVIVQALATHRPHFLNRFLWFTLLIGLSMVPYMTQSQGGGYERALVNRELGYSNPNAVAGWFGFCVVCMVIKGFIETHPGSRLLAWAMALISFYVVTMTVSRGAIIAIVGALLIASKRLLKGGFVPLLVLAGLVSGLVELGVFDQAVRSYSLRAGEETGRFRVWPLLIDKFLSSPLVGSGASHPGAITSTGKYVTPHNSFLLFAVASGIVPLVFFCAYLLRAGMAAFLIGGAEQGGTAFYLPLVVYAVLITCAGNMDFMTPWAIVSLALPLGRVLSTGDDD